MKIYDCSFSFTKLHDQAFQFDVNFLSDSQALVSKKELFFTQKMLPMGEEIFDVYSQNGTCPSLIDQLFTRSKTALFSVADEKGISAAAKKWSQDAPTAPSVLVLDLKDQKKSYLDKFQIMDGELAFCSFLQNRAPEKLLARAKKIQDLFQGPFPITFVLQEGSLKHDLLEPLSDPEKEFFLQNGKKFCQYAEPYMIGFKLGWETIQCSAENYFLSPSGKALSPAKITTTWYPEEYREIYSINSSFYQTLKHVFPVSGSDDEKNKMSVTSIKGQI